MNNQNIFVEVSIVENNDTTKRCLDMLNELLKAQSKVMNFLVSEGIDDSLEGEAMAEHLGMAVQAFKGILPEGVYDEVINKDVV